MYDPGMHSCYDTEAHLILPVFQEYLHSTAGDKDSSRALEKMLVLARRRQGRTRHCGVAKKQSGRYRRERFSRDCCCSRVESSRLSVRLVRMKTSNSASKNPDTPRRQSGKTASDLQPRSSPVALSPNPNPNHPPSLLEATTTTKQPRLPIATTQDGGRGFGLHNSWAADNLDAWPSGSGMLVLLLNMLLLSTFLWGSATYG